jgi:hypothetical protein
MSATYKAHATWRKRRYPADVVPLVPWPKADDMLPDFMLEAHVQQYHVEHACAYMSMVQQLHVVQTLNHRNLNS